jgi:hypothetical protein
MLLSIAIIILGLCVFEVISSIDNAVVNAHVLQTIPQKYRKIFLTWGLFFAVFVVRGLLPFVIVWLANPGLNVQEIFTSAFSKDSNIENYLEKSKPMLLLGGGMYLFLVFLSWLFMEEKKYAFLVEHFIHRQSAWFYAISSVVFTFVIFYTTKVNPYLALTASIGTTAFFITDGLKKNAEKKEEKLISSPMGIWSKLLYLEVLDMSFSIDGVVGAFAFTLSIPLIIIGNGLGAFVVREFTIRGMNLISKFSYLKNGAMYSIGMLGIIMILESFGKEFPFWMAPLNTFLLLGIFLFLSYRELKIAKVGSI